MYSLMYSKIKTLTEDFATFVTFKRIFSCIYYFILSKGFPPANTLSRLMPIKRFLSNMDSMMTSMGFFICEEFTTFITVIRFCFSVHSMRLNKVV